MRLSRTALIIFLTLYILDSFIITPYSFITRDDLIEKGALPNFFYQKLGVFGFYVSGILVVMAFIGSYGVLQRIISEERLILFMGVLIGGVGAALYNNFEVLGWIR